MHELSDEYMNMSEKHEQLKPQQSILVSGLDISKFGNTIDNPFFNVKEKILNKSLSFEERTNLFRYLQRIPHIEKIKHCCECITDILKDERYTLKKRYYFFSNNDLYVKLFDELVNFSHRWFFFDYKEQDAIYYKILSAQYIISRFPPETYDLNNLQDFLLNICLDEEQIKNYRTQSADILINYGYRQEVKKMAEKVISDIGLPKNTNKFIIYNDSENCHKTIIPDTIKNILKDIINDDKSSLNDNNINGSVFDRMLELNTNKENESKLRNVFERIMIDTSIYEDMKLSDIYMMVWKKIQKSKYKSELEKRLYEEMMDMEDTCSSGYLIRLINVFSGFDNFNYITISYKEQLRANVFAHYDKCCKSLSKQLQEQLSSEFISNDKPITFEIIGSYSPEEELQKEFVESGLLSQKEFNKVFKQSERDYFGIIQEERALE